MKAVKLPKIIKAKIEYIPTDRRYILKFDFLYKITIGTKLNKIYNRKYYHYHT